MLFFYHKKREEKLHRIYEGLGWCGTFAILVAYFGNSFWLFGLNSVSYQLLNIFGAWGIILVASMKKDYQPMVLNIVWWLIGIVALLSFIL